MDVYEDPSLGPLESPQIHDFNPGDLNPPGEPNHFLDGGVFWTRPVPGSSIAIHPGQGDAHFSLSDFSLLDYFNVFNAILRGGDDPLQATASVDIAWSGTGERAQVRNSDLGFAGNYENANASVQWSASNSAGYSFSTANSSDVSVAHAVTAQVRTGSFHP